VIAGALEIQMSANLARLSKDMQEAKGVVSGAMSAIERAAQQAMSALSSLGIGIGVGALGALAKSAIGRLSQSRHWLGCAWRRSKQAATWTAPPLPSISSRST
jgi:hypothetical protein